MQVMALLLRNGNEVPWCGAMPEPNLAAEFDVHGNIISKYHAPNGWQYPLVALYQQIAVPNQGQAQQLSPVDQLRWLLIRLSENWHRYRVFDWQPDVPWTNNDTKQVIGK